MVNRQYRVNYCFCVGIFVTGKQRESCHGHTVLPDPQERLSSCLSKSRDQELTTMITTPSILPPMPGSEFFIHNNDAAPAYWWLEGLWIILAEAKDTGGRFSMMEELMPKGSGPGPHKPPGPTSRTTCSTVRLPSSSATK